jgi:hypothetical protein
MRATRSLVAACALAAAGCGPGNGPYVDPNLPPGEVDADRDGVLASQDCDDHDASVWSLRVAYRDRDGDGAGSSEASTVCAGFGVPAGYVENANDCDDTRADAWHTIDAYADADGDGVGVGPPSTVCLGYALPAGWAPNPGNDCDDQDATVWQSLSYLYRDEDGDGYTTYLSGGVVCSGATLPPGYTNDWTGIDCDDADASAFAPAYGYVDADRDGVGAGSYVSVCAGTALPAGYASTGDDCAPDEATKWWLWSWADVDRDGDGFTRHEPGSLCSGAEPPAFVRWTRNGDDCDDGNASVWTSVTGYVDADKDGFGAGDPVASCTPGSLPAGEVATAGDCAPDDPGAWRMYAYRYRDADGDGRSVVEERTLCYGASLPAGYASTWNGFPLDCDDTNKAVWVSLVGYADTDRDGVGAGDAQTFCTAGSLPDGFVAAGTDCAPDDAGRWRQLAYAYVDRDGDGFTAREQGTTECIGATLPDPYRATASGNDCDDADTALYRWVVLYPDLDGDGIGAPPRDIQCLGATIPDGLSLFGWDENDRDPLVAAAPDGEASLSFLF